MFRKIVLTRVQLDLNTKKTWPSTSHKKVRNIQLYRLKTYVRNFLYNVNVMSILQTILVVLAVNTALRGTASTNRPKVGRNNRNPSCIHLKRNTRKVLVESSESTRKIRTNQRQDMEIKRKRWEQLTRKPSPMCHVSLIANVHLREN